MPVQLPLRRASSKGQEETLHGPVANVSHFKTSLFFSLTLLNQKYIVVYILLSLERSRAYWACAGFKKSDV